MTRICKKTSPIKRKISKTFHSNEDLFRKAKNNYLMGSLNFIVATWLWWKKQTGDGHIHEERK